MASGKQPVIYVIDCLSLNDNRKIQNGVALAVKTIEDLIVVVNKIGSKPGHFVEFRFGEFDIEPIKPIVAGDKLLSPFLVAWNFLVGRIKLTEDGQSYQAAEALVLEYSLETA